MKTIVKTKIKVSSIRIGDVIQFNKNQPDTFTRIESITYTPRGKLLLNNSGPALLNNTNVFRITISEKLTVAELIEKLKKVDQNLRVVKPGREGGVNDCEGILILKVLLNKNTESYYGKHDTCYQTDDVFDEKTVLIF